LGWPARCGQAC